MLNFVDEARGWIADPVARALAILAVTLMAAFALQRVVHWIIGAAVQRTSTHLDDAVYAALRAPIFLSVVLFGLHQLTVSSAPPWMASWTARLIQTAAVGLWLATAFRLSAVVFRDLVIHRREAGWLQPRTVPLYDMSAKFMVLGLSIYALMLIWDLNLTAWMASAGIAGIAVGFAAKDTLANLIAGLVIMADAPYKVGDYVVLEGGLRGEIRHMGMRSTRILTRDDVEITVPNALIGSSKIINEDGGHERAQRVCVSVAVAYGSDIDQVREVMLKCPMSIPLINESPRPDVRFREFGDSGLVFELLVWTDNARSRGSMIDQLNCAIYKAFQEAAIEIPYNKHDIYIKQMPLA